ncbi:MAG: DUF6797 domain-containing protein [Verrucomicrobiota bacterium]
MATLVALSFFLGNFLLNAEVAAKNDSRRKWVPQSNLDQDFPFQNACIGAKFPTNNIANKGIALKIGNDAFVCFDTDLLRMTAGWTGNYLNFEGVTFNDAHGPHPSIAGEQKFGTKVLPGFSDENGKFKDLRPEPFGPAPSSTARWNGLYLNGDEVIFSYTISGTKILELPASVASNGEVGFVRNFKIEKIKSPFSLAICDVENASGKVESNLASLETSDGKATLVGLVDAPKGVSLEIESARIVLKFKKGTIASLFKIVIWNGAKTNAGKFSQLLEGKPEMVAVKRGGPARWPETVETRGVLNFSSTPDGAYVVDQLTPPTENPWKRRVRFGGLDFFADGKRAALCTWDGDIWIVSGIDEKLEKLTWKRFASGSYETLGLKIVDDVIYTSGRDQITRYHDFNNDGEADFYENFNNEITSSPGFHEFVFDLQTDTKGNFYMAKGGPVRGGGRGFGGDNFGTVTAHAGTILKVSKDGKKLEVFATGFRAPNGMGVGPNNEITTGDNEGTWVPACPLNWIEQGGFYGVETLAHRNPIPQFKSPLCWMSHNDVDNSGGGQVWVTSNKWGPLEGELLHMSYGKSALYHVLKEQVGDQRQGGMVKIPLKFTSSTMRARFNLKDGQLYIAGLQGWQTTAVKMAGLDRVRHTGKAVYAASGLKVKKNAIEISFTQPLDPAYATDLQNYTAKRWNYRRAEDYGSPEFSVADPSKQCRDELPIQAAKLSADGRIVTLEIADLKPVMGQSINFNLKAKDGTEIVQSIQHTINVIP